MPAIYVFSKRVLKRARKDKPWLFGQKMESSPGLGKEVKEAGKYLGVSLPPSHSRFPLAIPCVFKKKFYSTEVTKPVSCWLPVLLRFCTCAPRMGH